MLPHVAGAGHEAARQTHVHGGSMVAAQGGRRLLPTAWSIVRFCSCSARHRDGNCNGLLNSAHGADAMTWRRGVGWRMMVRISHASQWRGTTGAHHIPANIPAASHTAAGATNLGRRRTWVHVVAGAEREGAAWRFMPAGIAVERPSPDSSVVEQWLSFKLRALSEGEGCKTPAVQQRFKCDRAANCCCCGAKCMPPPAAVVTPPSL
jgi:hypothetical protein